MTRVRHVHQAEMESLPRGSLHRHGYQHHQHTHLPYNFSPSSHWLVFLRYSCQRLHRSAATAESMMPHGPNIATIFLKLDASRTRREGNRTGAKTVTSDAYTKSGCQRKDYSLTGSSGLVVTIFKVGYWIAKTKDVFMPRIVRVLHRDLTIIIPRKYAKRQLAKTVP